MSGAVSPRARDERQDGAGQDARRGGRQDAACGPPASATRRSRSRPRGCVLGTARSASAEVMITIGRTRTVRVSAAGDQVAAVADAEGGESADEDGQAEEAVDDRGHAGEVPDVEVDEPGEPVVGRVLLEVDRRARSRAGRRAARRGPPMMTVPTMPWATPAFAGLLESAARSGSRRRAPGRPAAPSTSWSTTRTSEGGQREEERQEEEDLEDRCPLQSRCWARSDPRTTIAAAGRAGHRAAPSTSAACGGRRRRRRRSARG